jgi:cell division protein FtsB
MPASQAVRIRGLAGACSELAMKTIQVALVVVILALQYKLWLGPGSVRSLNEINEQLAAQRAVNAELEARNKRLEIEVLDLKQGLEAVEERARRDLGMIRSDETLYIFARP